MCSGWAAGSIDVFAAAFGLLDGVSIGADLGSKAVAAAQPETRS
jgi:hypothetical protein